MPVTDKCPEDRVCASQEMLAGTPFSRDSGVSSLAERPTACATVSQAPCETAPTRDSTPFYHFEFTAERKREMQKLLCSVLKGDYDSTSKHPRAAPWLPTKFFLTPI